MNVGEIFVALGFDVDSTTLNNFDDKVKGVTGNMWAAAAAAAGTVYAFSAFVSDATAGAAAMKQFGVETGLSQDKMRQWTVVGQLTNVNNTAQSVMGTVKALQKNINDIAWGKGNTAPFKWLGIDTAGKDAFQVLEQVRANMQENIARYGKSRTSQLIAEMGIDTNLINALMISDEQADALAKDRTLSPEQQKNLEDLGNKINDVTLRLKNYKDQLIADNAPTIIEYIDKADKFLIEFKTNLSSVIDWLKKFWNSMSPEMQGGIIGALIAISGAMFPLTALLGSLVFLTNEWGKHLRGLPSVFDYVTDAIDRTIAKWERFKEEFSGDLTINNWDQILKNIKTVANQPSAYFRPLGDSLDYFFANQPKNAAISLSPALTQQGGPGTVNNETTFNSMFTIHGANDPHATAGEVESTMRRSMNNAQESFNNGQKN